MKRRIFAFIVSVFCVILCTGAVAAENGRVTDALLTGSADEPNEMRFGSADEIAENVEAVCPDDIFGGLYYEGDTLVINLVGGQYSSRAAAFADMIDPDVKVEFRAVDHTLRELEDVKDFLGEYMYTFGISVLDANEVTNQVDISLRTYNRENIEALRRLVDEEFGACSFLNFTDYSDCTIQFTALSG